MSQTKVDWQHHLDLYRKSGQTVRHYCESAGLGIHAFKYHLQRRCKKAPARGSFKQFDVASELVIGRDHRGGLTVSGFDLRHLSEIVGAWSRAVSK
jgi:hypothetical protein